jgi:hypothetical protein
MFQQQHDVEFMRRTAENYQLFRAAHRCPMTTLNAAEYERRLVRGDGLSGREPMRTRAMVPK